MSYLILFVTGLLIGVLAGLLIYRRHAASLKSTEDKGKSILDALKGR
jgi:F0F1-type ATP synthase assembly protein I